MLAAVEEAYARPNPLEREQELDRHRWGRLDEMLLGHDFDLAAVMAYGLRLRIARRWQAMSDGAGRRRLDELVAKVEQ